MHERSGVSSASNTCWKGATNRRRVRADLIDVASGKEIWSDNFENDALNRDVFTVEDSIARSIVRQLLPHISRSVIAAKHGTESAEAHDLYLQGRYFLEKRDSAGQTTAQRYFERAISKDTMYALAYGDDDSVVIRGYSLGELVGKVSFAEAFLLLALGELPPPGHAHTFEAMLVSVLDHGIVPSSIVTRYLASSGTTRRGIRQVRAHPALRRVERAEGLRRQGSR